MKQLTEHLKTTPKKLSQYLFKGNKLSKTLSEELHDKLEKQLTIETKLREFGKQLVEENQILRELA